MPEKFLAKWCGRLGFPIRNASNVWLSDGIGIVQPFTLLEFAVRTVKSVLALLSAIGRISVATRWFVQVQLYRGS